MTTTAVAVGSWIWSPHTDKGSNEVPESVRRFEKRGIEMKVLHFSAEAIGEPDLKLSAELRGIADALLPGRVRNDTVLDVVPQARPSDVICYLTNMRPDIVHFSSHGEDKELQLCDAYFDPVPYPAKAMAAALKDKGVRLLVLNCCFSDSVADELLDDQQYPQCPVEVIICAKGKLPDDQAIVFSEVLYRGLQSGLMIGDAFDVAKGELSEAGRDIYECKARHETSKQTLLLSPGAPRDVAEPTPQQRTIAAAHRLEEIKLGFKKDARDSLLKFLGAFNLGLYASIVYWFVDWKQGISDELVSMFGWIQLDPWLIFTLLAAPPLLYLAEYWWLKKPVAEAQDSALWLAISPPESESQDDLADPFEALVAELDRTVQPLIGGQKND